MAVKTGMEFAGWILVPGKWVQFKIQGFWNQYIDLTDVQRENELLLEELKGQRLKLVRLEEKAKEADRLRRLLRLPDQEGWSFSAARVIAHQLGPNAVLQTCLIDRGAEEGVIPHIPVVTDEGVVGRVFRVSPHFSSLLLLSDPNSHIAVLGQESRTGGILSGKGGGVPLEMEYVPLNVPVVEGEILIASGLEQIYPKGLPVAKVVKVERSELSLFKKVQAEALVQAKELETVLLLTPVNATAEVVLKVPEQ